MPELPEVETIKETLKNYILKKKIISIKVNYPKIIANLEVSKFTELLKNQVIMDITRYGKYLIFNLSNGYLISHLRMEGKYYYQMEKEDKHTHVIFYFDDKTSLSYHDVRKFGRMHYFDKSVDIKKEKPLLQLGKEPFDLKDGSYLYQKVCHSNHVLKQILLDQSVMAGIGNIYADEICFACQLSPLKKGKTLTKKQCDCLVKESKKVLNKAIKLGGSTIKSYHSAQGIDGLFQNELQVYGKKDQPCPVCNNPILKVVVNGRGTHYCKHCQRK